jgi:hypothetical protein
VHGQDHVRLIGSRSAQPGDAAGVRAHQACRSRSSSMWCGVAAAGRSATLHAANGDVMAAVSVASRNVAEPAWAVSMIGCGQPKIWCQPGYRGSDAARPSDWQPASGTRPGVSRSALPWLPGWP